MKLRDKRFLKFEAMMFACSFIASAVMICLFGFGKAVFLNFLITACLLSVQLLLSGAATWMLLKDDKWVDLAIWELNFMFALCILEGLSVALISFHALMYFAILAAFMMFASAVPVVICCYAYSYLVKCGRQ